MIRVLLLLGLVGCYEAPTYESCTIGCTNACPLGMRCRDNLCVDEDSTESCAALRCPANYQALPGPRDSRYRSESMGLNMVGAAEDCADDDPFPGDTFFTHLVVVSDAVEYGALEPLAVGDFTIGHNDKNSEGTYLSVTMEDPEFLPRSTGGAPWAPNEPDAPKDCAVLAADGLVYARECPLPRGYICECDRFEDVPGRYRD